MLMVKLRNICLNKYIIELLLFLEIDYYIENEKN